MSLPSELGGGAGQGGAGAGGSEGLAPELDAGVLDATAGDAATHDAGQTSALGCLPADRANCDALIAALVHRYSFEGTGTGVVDSVGAANGSVVNGQLSGTGTVELSGSLLLENYVNLPNGIISGLGSATLEAWLSWNGGDPWQRIFDFGSSDGGEDERGVGANYLFLTPSTDDPIPTVRVAAFQATNPDTNGEVRVNSTAALPTGVEQQVAVVVNGQANTLALFINGSAAGSAALPSQLSAIDDVNNWLGRSQYNGIPDPGLAGSISEFRIYGAALSAEQVALSFGLGPDAPVSP
ncbi:MAG: LamG domain-containing protein [Deltaproteobacteria bacterium]